VHNVVKEISPISHRGSTGSMHQLIVMLGTLVSYIVGYLLSFTTKSREMWVIPFVIPCGASLISLLAFTFYFKHDSPLFYIAQGDMNYKTSYLYVYKEKEALLRAIESSEKERVEIKTLNISYSDLFEKYKNNILLVSIIAFFNQVNGINAIRYNSTAMFESISIPTKLAQTYTMIIGISLIVAPIISMVTSDSEYIK
jgi:Sugar (and other) transporter